MFTLASAPNLDKRPTSRSVTSNTYLEPSIWIQELLTVGLRQCCYIFVTRLIKCRTAVRFTVWVVNGPGVTKHVVVVSLIGKGEPKIQFVAIKVTLNFEKDLA